VYAPPVGLGATSVVSPNAQQSSAAYQVVKPVLLVLGSMVMKANCIGWSADHLPTINYS
jgi:hypothetical protein